MLAQYTCLFVCGKYNDCNRQPGTKQVFDFIGKHHDGLREFVSANERHPESVRVFPWLRPAAGDSVWADPGRSAGFGGEFSRAEVSIRFLSFTPPSPPQKIITFQVIITISDSLERSIIKISFEILIPKGPKSAPNHKINRKSIDLIKNQ